MRSCHAGNAGDAGDAGNAVEVHDLWAHNALALACGGALETLFAAVDALVCGGGGGGGEGEGGGTRDWAWDGAGRSRWRRRVVWNAYTCAEGERDREPPVWPETETETEMEMEMETVPVADEDGTWEEEDGGSLEGSDLGVDQRLDAEMGVDEPDLGWGAALGDHQVGIGEAEGDWNRWNRGTDGWGSPLPVRAELDGWSDWDEGQVGEIKHDAGRW
jgi:hypothetical protein